MRFLYGLLFVVLAVVGAEAAYSAEQVLVEKLHHLRVEGPREWTEFPEQAESADLVVEFQARKNNTEHAIRLRQQDIKQTWKVSLNGKELGRLPRDENDMVVYWSIAAGGLRTGTNTFKIAQSGRQTPDDIRVGEIVLFDQPLENVLSEGRVEIDVFDKKTQKRIPCRITVIDKNGSLVTVAAKSNDRLAVRPGVIYSSNGHASFGLPAGSYTVYAGRGFEWGIDTAELSVKPGETVRRKLSIRREVPTAGYVSCDTHVHTFTHSRHGDASIEERMISLAGEGIEFPIATDHNIHIDYEDIARKLNVRQYFTPVVGNEVTTKIGHFNVFPIKVDAEIPDYKLTEWATIFQSIYKTPHVQAVILNHARDSHSGYRPFGPKHHIALTGENLDGWKLKANAMELINSGATQTDPMQLYHDWMGLLNRGVSITPVGSSDSHDVARHFVGQGRTYIRADDSDPGKIDIAKTVKNFVEGRVLVSYGLLAEIEVNGKFGPGELAIAPGDVTVAVRVLGPSWVTAEKIELYANGLKIREATIPAIDQRNAGLKWKGEWTLKKMKHDVHLVAVASGPGVKELYWAMAKAYQPTSPVWKAYVVGSTGAVWIDVDGDGQKTSAYRYANRLVKASKNDLSRLFGQLANYDAAVAAQAAGLLQNNGRSLVDSKMATALKRAAPHVRSGFQNYLSAWRKSEIARAER